MTGAQILTCARAAAEAGAFYTVTVPRKRPYAPTRKPFGPRGPAGRVVDNTGGREVLLFVAAEVVAFLEPLVYEGGAA